MCLWLWPTVCSAIEPGYYPSRAGEIQSTLSESESELLSLVKSKSVGLWIEAADRIRIWSKDPDVPIHATMVFHTRAEISKCLENASHKHFLFAQISTVDMWSNREKSANLAIEVEPFLDKLGYGRILIFGCKPHDDAHPENGTEKADFFVFKDKHYPGSKIDNENNFR
jgi:hypothetical protein